VSRLPDVHTADTDPLKVSLYEAECSRHRDNARRALEYAAQRLDSALKQWEQGPTTLAVADARHAAALAAEGYAEVQAFVALRDVRFLVDDAVDKTATSQERRD
jgi:hypothetical protein